LEKVTGKQAGMTEQERLAQVAIGIATKNRWEDLRDTLERIAAFGLGGLPTLIFDDGSDAPCPYDVRAICAGAELQRFTESAGYIVRRNQLARAMTAKYYLSLDDDSFPLAGSLAAAVAFAESRDDLFCLSFPICNSWISEAQVMPLATPPHPVRAFVGCAHMLHRQRFIEAGGYREELLHQSEEVEIAARLFMSGLKCYRFPGLRIYHTEASAGRSLQRMDYYAARNAVLWNDWYMPGSLLGIKQARGVVARLLSVAKTRRLGHLKGLLAGLQEIRQYRAHRRRMPLDVYRRWQSLPAD
jgi:Glycosyl transferase family 2